MITILKRFVGVLALTALFAVPAMSAQDIRRDVQLRAAIADDCTPSRIADSLNMDVTSLSPATGEQLVSWCKRQQAIERDAQTDARSLSASRAPSPSDPTEVAMDDGTLSLLCGRNNCVCWKGPRYDGCHHTDIMCRPNTFKCVGKVCGCTTVPE